MTNTDLQVEPVSHSLAGKLVDVVVTGSIGAVESVRFVRALRRLGAKVNVTLSRGGAQFVTPMALEWASTQPVQTEFSGTASHVAGGDLCVVTPASANFIQKLAEGRTDTPSSALATSYLGAGRPVLVLPNMHASLKAAPAVKENIDKISKWAVLLEPRQEEEKAKFPAPDTLADIVSHHANRNDHRITVAFGGTKAYIDDVRYLGNYSSGALGTSITQELFRQGYEVDAVVGSATVLPSAFSSLHRFETNADLEHICLELVPRSDGLVFLPAVLDYIPKTRQTGKVRSGQGSLSIELQATDKIIAKLKPNTGAKIGFKLEVGATPESSKALAKEYLAKYDLSLFVLNDLKNVDSKSHRASIFTRNEEFSYLGDFDGKQAIAESIASHVRGQLT